MVRKSRAITVPKNEETDDELIEKRFKKLIQETKNKEFKKYLKNVFTQLKPDDFPSNKDFVKTIRRFYLDKTLTICELAKCLSETKKELKECQERASQKPKLTE